MKGLVRLRLVNVTSGQLTFVVFALALLNLLLKARSQYISPWDELYHLSYVQYVYNLHIPRYGDVLNTWSRSGFSCYDVFVYGRTSPIPCGSIGDPISYPEGGTNTAAIWPPIYYSLLAVLVKVSFWSGIDPIFLGRIFTAMIWACGCAALTYVLLRNQGNRFVSFSVGILTASLPFAMFQGAFVNPHSMAPLLVAGLLWFVLPALRNSLVTKRSTYQFASFSIVAVLALPQLLPVIAASSLFLLIATKRKLGESQSITSPQKLIIGLVPIAAFLTLRMWSAIQDWRKVSWQGPVDLNQTQKPNDPGFGITQILDSLWRFIPHSIDGYQFLGPAEIAIATLWAYILFGLIGAALISPQVKNLKALTLTLWPRHDSNMRHMV
jgi:hypothetical protein